MHIQIFSPPPGKDCTFHQCRSGAVVHVRMEHLDQGAMAENCLLCTAHFLLWASEYETWELERHPMAFAAEEPLTSPGRK